MWQILVYGSIWMRDTWSRFFIVFIKPVLRLNLVIRGAIVHFNVWNRLLRIKRASNGLGQLLKLVFFVKILFTHKRLSHLWLELACLDQSVLLSDFCDYSVHLWIRKRLIVGSYTRALWVVAGLDVLDHALKQVEHVLRLFDSDLHEFFNLFLPLYLLCLLTVWCHGDALLYGGNFVLPVDEKWFHEVNIFAERSVHGALTENRASLLVLTRCGIHFTHADQCLGRGHLTALETSDVPVDGLQDLAKELAQVLDDCQLVRLFNWLAHVLVNKVEQLHFVVFSWVFQ